MKKLVCLLCVLLLLSITCVSAGVIVPYSEICTHMFTLASARSPEPPYEFLSPTQYEALCLICDLRIPLTPVFSPPETAHQAPETCVHDYYWIQAANAVVMEQQLMQREPGHLSHGLVNHYTCICIQCGDTFEISSPNGRAEFCKLTRVGDIHMSEQPMHLFIDQCIVCGGYCYTMEPCSYIEEISGDYCMHVIGEHQ